MGKKKSILEKQISNLLKLKFITRFQIINKKHNDTSKIKKIRRDISRTKTVINSKKTKNE